MEHLGIVSTEGGLILIAEASVAQNWTGALGEDYARASTQLLSVQSADIVDIKGHQGIVWDTQSSGTVDIFLDDNNKSLIIVHAWLSDEDESGIEILAQQPVGEIQFNGVLELESDLIIVMWAAESGEEIILDDAEIEEVSETDEGSMLIQFFSGRMSCLSDMVSYKKNTASRFIVNAGE